ncbi:MAG TPA: 1,4-dihydroxy-2-naphthoate polyprenyltransferase [Acidimicrobiia bacterium]|nr:1,4-dihydroxy-2-naphthoate polyprenyltransferase [Acidimicrobiia bacterium]
MRAWLEAARPRTLPAAVAPVLVGTGLAAADGVYRPDAFVLALLGALAIQVAANFANDVSDASRGADAADRVGPIRMVATGQISPRAMWIATGAAVLTAAAAGVGLIIIAGWPIAIIGLASIVAMLTYVGGPIPYGYRAMGEVFVFVFFGLVATVGTRFAHGGSAPGIDAWILGAVMGGLAAAILVANNLRDIVSDTRVGKRTLSVVLGRDRTRRLYAWLMYGSFVVVAVASILRVTPVLTGLAALWVPFAVRPVAVVANTDDPVRLIGVLGTTARIQLLVGATLGMAAAFS